MLQRLNHNTSPARSPFCLRGSLIIDEPGNARVGIGNRRGPKQNQFCFPAKRTYLQGKRATKWASAISNTQRCYNRKSASFSSNGQIIGNWGVAFVAHQARQPPEALKGSPSRTTSSITGHVPCAGVVGQKEASYRDSGPTLEFHKKSKERNESESKPKTVPLPVMASAAAKNGSGSGTPPRTRSDQGP